MEKNQFWSSQGSVLGPRLFLIYINDLADGMTSLSKIFVDDASLFSKVQDINRSANELNCDLEKVSNWAYQWKMQFNPDPNKQANKVIFSRKSNSVFPIHLLNLMRIILLNALIRNI